MRKAGRLVTAARHLLHPNYPDLAVELGARIKEGRERIGWTQRGLARRLDVTHAAVNSWEQGYVLPRFEIALALARIMGFALDDLAAPARAINTEDQ